MFAIVRTGGKQYKAEPQKVILIEKLEAQEGDFVTLDKILMVSEGNKNVVGTPYIEGAFVKGIVVEQRRCDKIIVFKKKRRHNYRRKQGHRQFQTVVRIMEISGPSGLHYKSDVPIKAQSSPKATSVEPDVREKKESQDAPSKKTSPQASVKKESGKETTKAHPKVAPQKKAASPTKKTTPPKSKES